jgi:hypothetical protein
MRFSSSEACLEQIRECKLYARFAATPNRDLFRSPINVDDFDETLRQALAVQLEQSPFLSLVSDQRIQETLRLMVTKASPKQKKPFAATRRTARFMASSPFPIST